LLSRERPTAYSPSGIGLPWRLYLIGAVSILVGALLAMMGLDRVHQLWEGRSYGNPLSSCEASVVVEGDFPKVFARCKEAQTALQAIKARGWKIEVRENWGLLEGGTGAWPHPSRERVVVEVKSKGRDNQPAIKEERAQQDAKAWLITMKSVSYCPGFRKYERNAATVQFILNRVV
jgi:hypothetical protein